MWFTTCWPYGFAESKNYSYLFYSKGPHGKELGHKNEGFFAALAGGKASLEVDYSDAIDKSREKAKIPTSFE